MNTYEPEVGETCEVIERGDPEACYTQCTIRARHGDLFWVDYGCGALKTESLRHNTFRSKAAAAADRAAAWADYERRCAK